MFTNHKLVLFLVTAIVAVFAIPAQAVLIDDFTDSSSLTIGPSPEVDFVSTPDAAPFGSIIGGERLSHVRNGGSGLVILETKTGTGIPDSIMSFSAEVGVFDNFYFTYDAGGTGLGSGNGEDLTIGGDNAFEIVVNLADVPVELEIHVYDADGDFDYEYSIPMPGLLPGGAPVGVHVPYASFDPSIDFDKVTRLTFGFSAMPTATNLEILSLNTTLVVPEPTTLAGLSLMGLIVLSRRRRLSI